MIALADGSARILDLEEETLAVLEGCLRYQTGPVWIDNTTESQSPGGTPFTLLGASSDYLYFGHREKFNKLQFTLQTLGSYGARTWEYAKGDGTWAAITPDSDSTNGFSQNGTVSISPAFDWKTDTVNAIGGKYWLRVKVASLTIAATVLQIQVNVAFNCLMFDPHFEESADLYDRQPYSCVFVQKEDPS